MSERVLYTGEMDIPALHEAYLTGTLSPVRVTQELLEKVRAEQPRINAFITIAEEMALEQAGKSEARYRKGTPIGILDGVPYTVKDIVDVGGVPTTYGCRLYADNIPAKSAFAVAKLEQAGAVMLGKVNTSQFALGATGEVSAWGPCCNPYDPERITGGSSSGSAASVAANLCQFSLGTDTGGSVRAPAALCGIYSIRPSMGLVSGEGILQNCQFMDTIGVLSRNVQDNAIVLDAICGYDPDYPLSRADIANDHVSAVDQPLEGMTLGVPYTFFRDGVSDYVWDALCNAVQVFEQAGVIIKEITMPDIGEYRGVMSKLLISEAYAMHADVLRTNREAYAPELLSRFADGAAVTTVEYVRMRRQIFTFRRKFSALFEGVDAVLLPTQATVAVKRNSDPSLVMNGSAANLYEISSRYLWFTAFAGTAAMNVPCGFYKGLPLGMQLLAPKNQEKTLYRFASRYQNNLKKKERNGI